MQGNAKRLRDQCMRDDDFMECLELDYWECLLIGTSWDVVMQALKRIPKTIKGTDRTWRDEKHALRQRLRARTLNLKVGEIETGSLLEASNMHE